MNAIMFALAACTATPAAQQWPLAAAFVIAGQVEIFDVATRSLKPVPLDGLVPGEADLSPNRERVVVNARPRSGGRSRLYLVEVESGSVRELPAPAGGGDLQFARFGLGGKTVVFTAAPHPGRDGPGNRTQVKRIDLASGKIEDIPTDPDHCELAPAELLGDRIAHISTTCFVSFAVDVKDIHRGATRTVGQARSPQAEAAASPDGKKLVYTKHDMTGLSFWLVEGDRGARRLAVTPAGNAHVQPRFVCPQNLVFFAGGAIWNLDTKSAELTELLRPRRLALHGIANENIEPRMTP